MFVDYYAILGVAPDATLDQIIVAYRLAAIKNHPDRGGSHEKMVLVNEAWEILSDASRRAEYDRVRSSGHTRDLSTWTEGTEDIRRKAQNYPQQWDEFEKWMNWFIADIKSAKYGQEKIGWFTFPTATGSLSGQSFILLGGLAGIFFGYLIGLYPALLNVVLHKPIAPDSIWVRIIFPHISLNWIIFAVIPLCIGASLGQVAHMALGYILENTAQRTSPPIKQNETSGPQSPTGTIERIVLQCPKCGQPLRLPKQSKELLVTCPSCKTRFTHNPSA